MSGRESMELTGTVRRVTFHNPETGYSVTQVDTGSPGDPVTVVGRMPGVSEGARLQVRGRQVLHPKFGPQVEAEHCEVLPPGDAEGVRRYLASGLVKGVGPVLAGRIVDTLGPEALEIISQKPERLTQVPGIGRKRAREIGQAVASQEALREVMVFLQGHGVGASTALRIYRHYGQGCLEVLQREPHRLAADIAGIGFVTADQIAAKLGIEKDHPSRLYAGLVYVLKSSLEEGHLYLPQEELFDQAAELLSVDRALLGPAFLRLHNERRVLVEGDLPERPVYLAAGYHQEEIAARHLGRLAGQPGLLPPERAVKAAAWAGQSLGLELAPGQAQALEDLLSAGLGILTGGPGTGKTTLVRSLVLVARRLGVDVALAAPTGRAAKRLAEAAGLPAMTLHRLLEYDPKENRFERGPDHPLDAGLVVVDESSMIDSWLGAHLAAAVGQDAVLILVGDANQLPPVGPGLFFRQTMDSGRAVVAALTEIFRQREGGLIVQNAHRVLHGQEPLLPAKGQEADFFFLRQDDSDQAAELVRDLVARRLPAHYGLDPWEDIQVLSPMKKGRLGCARLNQLLRQALLPQAGADPGLVVGDKVMQVRNNYDLDVFNGDLGRVQVRDDEGLVVDMDKGPVRYSLAEADDLNLAYAVTVHKSQGSEYPAVVIALAGEHFVMLHRALFYTALTRGKRLVVVVGSQQAISRAIARDQPAHRNTLLAQRLAGKIGGRAE